MSVETNHEPVATSKHIPHDESYDRTSSIVKSIEQDIGSKGADTVSSHVRDEVYGELSKLRTKDGSSKGFNEDLSMLNARLQHDGYLPNMFIVGNNDGDKGTSNNELGPTTASGFHLSKTEYKEAPLAPKGAKVDQSAPPATPYQPGQQTPAEWSASNPAAAAGSDGGNGGNAGGNTPIESSNVQSNPVAGGTLSSPQLISEIGQALKQLNAQRAAEGLPPIQDNAANQNAILEIIQHESSGNPNAENNTDSNAAAGDPSRGLMQTIGTTFSAYHVKGTSSNIFDPVANIAAGVNYAVSRYGSLANTPGPKSIAAGGQYLPY